MLVGNGLKIYAVSSLLLLLSWTNSNDCILEYQNSFVIYMDGVIFQEALNDSKTEENDKEPSEESTNDKDTEDTNDKETQDSNDNDGQSEENSNDKQDSGLKGMSQNS